jgi:epoxide hydrolase
MNTPAPLTPASPGPAAADIVPFRIAVPEADLADLRERLGRTRFPEPATVAGWEQGIPVEDLQKIVTAWRNHDWRASEDRLNTLPHFRTTIDGLRIHFLHLRSPHPEAFPILLTHGWPGSFLEFEKVLGPLIDPVAHGGRTEDAFHVVVPSLPGYGFSDRPSERGWNTARTARAWRELMARLGYEHYGAQGGDWGMLVTSQMTDRDPDGDDRFPVPAGIHLSPARPAGPRDPRRPDRRRDGLTRRDAGLPRHRDGLRRADVHPPADDRVRAHRLARRPRGADRGKAVGVERQRRPA